MLLPVLVLVVTAQFAFAGSATWNLSPTSGDWNNAANWTPATVPNGPSDTATFNLSNTTNVFLSAVTEANGVVFGSDAGPFTISVNPTTILTIDSGGVVNNSSAMQNVVVETDSRILFQGSASAGSQVSYEIKAMDESSIFPGAIIFFGTSSAGAATLVARGGIFEAGGAVQFTDASNGGDCTVIVEGATKRFAFPAFLDFGGITEPPPTAGNGNYIIMGGAVPGAPGGLCNSHC